MKEVLTAMAFYDESSTITFQGDKTKADVFLKKGYTIKEYRNGFWVLIRKFKVYVTLVGDCGSRTFEVKDNVLEYYGRKKISVDLAERFKNDVSIGKIIFKMDETCSMYTME